MNGLDIRSIALIGLLTSCSPKGLDTPDAGPLGSGDSEALPTSDVSAASLPSFDFVPQAAEIVATMKTRDDALVGVMLKLHEIDPGRCGEVWGKSMMFALPKWDGGATTALESLVAVPVGHWSSAETWVMAMDRALDDQNTPDSRRDRRIAWHPAGTIEVVDAAREVGQTGRVSVKLANGDLHFEKVFPVRICMPIE